MRVLVFQYSCSPGNKQKKFWQILQCLRAVYLTLLDFKKFKKRLNTFIGDEILLNFQVGSSEM